MGKIEVERVNEIIRQLKNGEIQVPDVPVKFQEDMRLIQYERAAGKRLLGKRGFDVISDTFFVEEELVFISEYEEEQRETVFASFPDFISYYNYLDGDIYNNACYAFHHIPEDKMITLSIDIDRLNIRKSLISETISDFVFDPEKEKKEAFNRGEANHRQCKKWAKKFLACSNGIELLHVRNNYWKSKLKGEINTSFFLYLWLFAGEHSKSPREFLSDLFSSGVYCADDFLQSLCWVFGSNVVLDTFSMPDCSKATYYRYKNRLKENAKLLDSESIIYKTYSYFDSKTHYFCEVTEGYEIDKQGQKIVHVRVPRYFESFNDFISYRKGNLSHCDLSNAIGYNIDYTKYYCDETTILPRCENGIISYSLEKSYSNGEFHVIQRWSDEVHRTIKKYRHEFRYFFDFVAFLQGDLSDADLLLCDGLENLKGWDGIDFRGAKLKSNLCRKFKMQFIPCNINTSLIETFDVVERSEKETAPVLLAARSLAESAANQELSIFDAENNINCQKVYYITDLHLLHRLQDAKCQSQDDIEYTVRKIVQHITEDLGALLLIGGDVSTDFSVFTLFVKLLAESLQTQEYKFCKTTVVFVLGNHELWPFPDLSVEEIALRYRELLKRYGMYLLHNDLLYLDEYYQNGYYQEEYHQICFPDICSLTDSEINERLKKARFVIFGGPAFSGYNTEFNADNGIYRKTIDRVEEILQTKTFEDLYTRLSPILRKKNAIILSHTPKKDWCHDPNLEEGFVYVSGHTHRNAFYDDGAIRLYADNQIGYHNESIGVKWFLLDDEYDSFEDYPDGIHEITREQYIDFYRGKNIELSFRRSFSRLFMLKKRGYYCFILENNRGLYGVLNGGSYTLNDQINRFGLKFCYDKMDGIIARIKTPLDQYTAIQKPIAQAVVRIGGKGTIHGCIVDIDFYNHIYVDPFDLTITPYYATDIVNKIIYPTIPSLLESACPKLYGNYMHLLNGEQSKSLAILETTSQEKPQINLDTRMYRASRVIKKMQKLNSHILSVWYEDPLPDQILLDPQALEVVNTDYDALALRRP